MGYPNNELNNDNEAITSANMNYGFYTLCYGGTTDIAKVPKIAGLQYLDTDTYTLYSYIDGTGELNGWTKIASGSDSSVLARVLVDNVTVFGDGHNVPLSASPSIPDYDPNVQYGNGRLVHATFNGIRGIYRHTADPKTVWGIINCSRFLPNKSRVFNPGEYFYIDSFDHTLQENDGIYRINPALQSGIAMIITPSDMHDLQDHIQSGNVQIITNGKGEGTATKWVSNKLYVKNEKVYIDGDFSKLYYMLLDSHLQVIFNVYDTSVLKWQLIADIGPVVTATLKPGCMILFVGTNIPEGYLSCNGATVNIVDYPLLFAEIGKKYGGTDTTFNLPTADNMIIKAV